MILNSNLAATVDKPVTSITPQQHALEQPLPAVPEQSNPLRIEASSILGYCGGDPGLFAELTQMFPDESRKLLETVEQARASGDAAVVQMNAHSLKSMCSVFEAREAADAAFQLEQAARDGNLGTDQQWEFLKTEMVRVVDAVHHLALTS